MPNAVRIDFEELAYAFGDQRVYAAHAWYLDRTSGDLVLFTNETPEASRFLYVPPRPTRDVLADMRCFADTVRDGTLKCRLVTALAAKSAFRRFKDTLLEAPEFRDGWLVFERARMRDHCTRWLAAHGIAASARCA
jgi:hypothetical protein